MITSKVSTKSKSKHPTIKNGALTVNILLSCPPMPVTIIEPIALNPLLRPCIVSSMAGVSLRLSILIKSYEDPNVPVYIVIKHSKI